jgi:predicted amidohydrolase YtcJ
MLQSRLFEVALLGTVTKLFGKDLLMRLSCCCSLITVLAFSALPLQATTLLINAHVHTMDTEHPEATALAWKDDGRLLDVGDTADLQRRYPDAAKIDAQGATVIPGLIDAHGHMLGLGMTHIQVDLDGTTSKAQILERLKVQSTKLPKSA